MEMGLNGWGYYLFAFFVFLLLCLLVLIIVKSYKSADKKSKLADMDREERILNLYGKVDDMLEAVEDYIEESKKQIDEQALKAEQASLRAQEYLRMAATYHAQTVSETQASVLVREGSSKSKAREEAKPVPQQAAKLVEKTAAAQRDVMMGRVSELDIEGKTIDEIAEQLGYSKGEIAFMLNLLGSREGQAPVSRPRSVVTAKPKARPDPVTKPIPDVKAPVQPAARPRPPQQTSMTALPFESQLEDIRAQVEASRPREVEKKPSTVIRTVAREERPSMTVDELTQRIRRAASPEGAQERAEAAAVAAERKQAVAKRTVKREEQPVARKKVAETKVKKTVSAETKTSAKTTEAKKAAPAGTVKKTKTAKPAETEAKTTAAQTKVKRTATSTAQKTTATATKVTKATGTKPAGTKAAAGTKTAAKAAPQKTATGTRTVNKTAAEKPAAAAARPAAPRTGAVIREPAKKNVRVQKRA